MKLSVWGKINEDLEKKTPFFKDKSLGVKWLFFSCLFGLVKF
jgi:hypothetical protein